MGPAFWCCVLLMTLKVQLKEHNNVLLVITRNESSSGGVVRTPSAFFPLNCTTFK